MSSNKQRKEGLKNWFGARSVAPTFWAGGRAGRQAGIRRSTSSTESFPFVRPPSDTLDKNRRQHEKTVTVRGTFTSPCSYSPTHSPREWRQIGLAGRHPFTQALHPTRPVSLSRCPSIPRQIRNSLEANINRMCAWMK
eukprot:GHVU01032946.1.p2 GENE.GHVU01032946.1~~GHVU01032946.1.p2  ORF type:complete len:138 (+),score=2.46 GHVU01032946.1:449-862(+)